MGTRNYWKTITLSPCIRKEQIFPKVATAKSRYPNPDEFVSSFAGTYRSYAFCPAPTTTALTISLQPPTEPYQTIPYIQYHQHPPGLSTPPNPHSASLPPSLPPSTIALFSRLDVSHSLASTDRPSLHAPSTLDISTFPSSSLSWLDRLSASRKVFTTFPLHFTCFLSIHRRPHGHPWFPSRSEHLCLSHDHFSRNRYPPHHTFPLSFLPST